MKVASRRPWRGVGSYVFVLRRLSIDLLLLGLLWLRDRWFWLLRTSHFSTPLQLSGPFYRLLLADSTNVNFISDWGCYFLSV